MNNLIQFKEEWLSLKEADDSELSPKTKKKGEEYYAKICAIQDLY